MPGFFEESLVTNTRISNKIIKSNNWYTIETQSIDPFVLEDLPLFTICPSGR